MATIFQISPILEFCDWDSLKSVSTTCKLPSECSSFIREKGYAQKWADVMRMAGFTFDKFQPVDTSFYLGRLIQQESLNSEESSAQRIRTLYQAMSPDLEPKIRNLIKINPYSAPSPVTLANQIVEEKTRRNRFVYQVLSTGLGMGVRYAIAPYASSFYPLDPWKRRVASMLGGAIASSLGSWGAARFLANGSGFIRGEKFSYEEKISQIPGWYKSSPFLGLAVGKLEEKITGCFAVKIAVCAVAAGVFSLFERYLRGSSSF